MRAAMKWFSSAKQWRAKRRLLALHAEVSCAIMDVERAEDESDSGLRGQKKVYLGWLRVAKLEQRIVELTQAGTPEGDIARAGAVSAYVACGDLDLARALAREILADPALSDARKKEIAAMVA